MKRNVLKSLYEGRQINDNEKVDYFYRLITKTNSDKYFINEYLDGQGNELQSKFFSKISSSRLCFELYSWLCNEKNIKNFAFEKKLIGLKGYSSVPNMDVYFELNDDIIFIESKYSETHSNSLKDKLSDAYYMENKKLGSSKDENTLKYRFYENDVVMSAFSSFVKNVYSNKKLLRSSWFDIKQEMTHLFGIIFYFINNNLKDKNIKFYNIIYKFDDFDDLDISKEFIDLAQDMIKKLIESKVLKCKEFIYKVYTAQDIVNNNIRPLPLDIEFNKNKKAFGTSETIGDRLKQFNL